MITADQAVRGGKIIELKQVVNDAVSKCPTVKRVFVAQRTGADVAAGPFDIPLEKVSKVSTLFSSCVSCNGGRVRIMLNKYQTASVISVTNIVV